ncbi:hypothetical protein D3C87_1817300 [compost metagenome]
MPLAVQPGEGALRTVETENIFQPIDLGHDAGGDRLGIRMDKTDRSARAKGLPGPQAGGSPIGMGGGWQSSQNR